LNKGRVHFVVVFNLTRFARDKYDHFALRSHLQSLGISLRSATEPIDDTSTGKLMQACSPRSRSSTMTCARTA
jgi:site-specific DNA recombinase